MLGFWVKKIGMKFGWVEYSELNISAIEYRMLQLKAHIFDNALHIRLHIILHPSALPTQLSWLRSIEVHITTEDHQLEDHVPAKDSHTLDRS